MIGKRFAGILIPIFVLFMVSGCANKETIVEQTVGGTQVKIGSYSIDISDEFKYLGNMPAGHMIADGDGVVLDSKQKLENHVFVKGVSASEGILVQVESLPPQWIYHGEVDFEGVIRKGVVQHGRKNNLPYVIQKFNNSEKLFLELVKFASEKGHIYNEKQYVYVMTQGRVASRDKRFFLYYLRGFENLPTDAGGETYQSANIAFTITN